MISRILIFSKCILILIAAILSCFLYRSPLISSKILDILHDNFYNPMLTSISPQTSEELENEDCETYRFGEWKGTEEGCDCTQSFTNVVGDNCKNNVCTESCSYRQRKKWCRNVPENKAEDLNLWNGVGICQNKSEPTYYDYLINNVQPAGTDSCQEGMKKCGILDTFNNILCLPESQPCPINYISITTSQDPPETDFPIDNTVPFGVDKYLHYSTQNTNGKVIGHFRIGETNLCANPDNFYSENPDTTPYVLEAIQQFGCKQLGNYVYDDRFEKIDTMNKATFYFQNNILQKLNQLPSYDLQNIQNTEISLFIAPYFGFDKFCLDKHHFDKNVLGDGKNFLKRAKQICVALNVLLFISLFFEVGFIIYHLFSLYSLVMLYFICGFNLFLLAIDLILASVLISDVNKVVSLKECSDVITNLAISSMHVVKQKGYKILVWVLVFVIFTILILAALIIYDTFFKSRKDRGKENYNKDFEPSYQEEGDKEETENIKKDN